MRLVGEWVQAMLDVPGTDVTWRRHQETLETKVYKYKLWNIPSPNWDHGTDVKRGVDIMGRTNLFAVQVLRVENVDGQGIYVLVHFG